MDSLIERLTTDAWPADLKKYCTRTAVQICTSYSTFLILDLVLLVLDLVVLLVGSKKSIEVGVTSPALLTADEYCHSLSGSIVD